MRIGVTNGDTSGDAIGHCVISFEGGGLSDPQLVPDGDFCEVQPSISSQLIEVGLRGLDRLDSLQQMNNSSKCMRTGVFHTKYS